MRYPLFFLLFLLSVQAKSQKDTTQWLRAFPITSYMVPLNDSVTVVQLEMPEEHVIKDKQLGLLRGVYKTAHADTATKGFGKCNLIKGHFYYFTISNNNSGLPLKEGDLLYTFMKKTNIHYGRIPKLAAHFIQMQDVYETRFYDRYTVFLKWSEAEETALLDSMVKDIRFTGNYFLENNPSLNAEIKKGDFKGQQVLTVMVNCKTAWLLDFFDYVLARPRLYAGRQWKLSEVFATWLSEGAPKVIAP